ncbi:MAG: sialate O-acetylesterase, partial [Planctomycetales bacterium]
MRLSRMSRWATVALALCLTWSAKADVKLGSIFSNDMVLQREIPAPVWGWAPEGEEVAVEFAGQTKTTKAGADGKWMVKLDPLKANAQGQTLTISGKNEIKLENVLVGEVWICSGQSNMEWAVGGTINAKEEIAAADHPTIRMFNVPGHTVSPTPKDECPGSWKVCGPKTIGGFSAVGYFFGRRLQKELGVPIGLVGSNLGGTRIEPWVPAHGFDSVKELAPIAEQVSKFAEGAKVGGGTPTAIYNAMVHPLTPFAMRGVIWYQG